MKAHELKKKRWAQINHL